MDWDIVRTFIHAEFPRRYFSINDVLGKICDTLIEIFNIEKVELKSDGCFLENKDGFYIEISPEDIFFRTDRFCRKEDLLIYMNRIFDVIKKLLPDIRGIWSLTWGVEGTYKISGEATSVFRTKILGWPNRWEPESFLLRYEKSVEENEMKGVLRVERELPEGAEDYINFSLEIFAVKDQLFDQFDDFIELVYTKFEQFIESFFDFGK